MEILSNETAHALEHLRCDEKCRSGLTQYTVDLVPIQSNIKLASFPGSTPKQEKSGS